MGWRFRKSFKVLPGVKINFNKNSTGITFGTKGAHYTINSKGKHTASIGIPGSGLYYTETVNTNKRQNQTPNMYTTSTNNQMPSSSGKGCLITIIIIILLFVGCVSNCGTNRTETNATDTAALSEIYTETTPQLTKFTTASLNVRSGPGTKYSIIDTLAPNTAVVILSEDGNWSEIEYNTAPAYVSSSYLSSDKQPEETEYQGPMVWVSYYGKKYHSRPSCGNMKGASQVPLKDAQTSGKTPCSKCY